MTHTDIPPHLMNEHYDDRYFDVVSALDEARQIFFENNSLPERLASHATANRPFHIGETGFGAGRNVVALLAYLSEREQVPPLIVYNTVELHPMDPDRMSAILDAFRPRAGTAVDMLVSAYRTVDRATPGWHSMDLPFHTGPMHPGSLESVPTSGMLRLNLFLGEALEMVRALPTKCDVWFLDGHGPKKNPDMWRQELLTGVAEKTVPEGTLTTFTVAGMVRRGLEEAGFTIQKLPGCGGKKSVLHAHLPKGD